MEVVKGARALPHSRGCRLRRLLLLLLLLLLFRGVRGGRGGGRRHLGLLRLLLEPLRLSPRLLLSALALFLLPLLALLLLALAIQLAQPGQLLLGAVAAVVLLDYHHRPFRNLILLVLHREQRHLVLDEHLRLAQDPHSLVDAHLGEELLRRREGRRNPEADAKVFAKLLLLVPHAVPRLAHLHRLEHARVVELLRHLAAVKHLRHLEVGRLDAADVVRVARREHRDELRELRLEL
mmetsp:Transcript_22722/g.73951  ORF Transcript_22722/g.73951 Transcript_22722/m.73951 type:complete len:236 (+) Transcript_22722:1375-2082(+)